jgi:hypothetical protein
MAPTRLSHSPPNYAAFSGQPLLRECFVLRILMGLSPRVSAELLDISITEFEDAIYAALNQLPLLCSAKT